MESNNAPLDKEELDLPADHYKKHKRVFGLVGGIAALAAILIYSVFFNSLSETMLVQLSFLWIAPVIFSVVGFISIGEKSENPYKPALIAGAGSLIALQMFYSAFWSSL